MSGRSVDRSRTAGQQTLNELLTAVPARQPVWAGLSPEDQDILVVWLGMSPWPATRRDRRRRAEAGLDLDVETLRRILHENGAVGYPSNSAVPPF